MYKLLRQETHIYSMLHCPYTFGHVIQPAIEDFM